MSQANEGHTKYRGYHFEISQFGADWRVNISPGPSLLRTRPDHVSAPTQDVALAKARALVDHHLSR